METQWRTIPIDPHGGISVSFDSFESPCNKVFFLVRCSHKKNCCTVYSIQFKTSQWYTAEFILFRECFNAILSKFKGENFAKCWAICDANDSNTLLLSIQKLMVNKYCRGILNFNVSKCVLLKIFCEAWHHLIFICRVSLIFNRSIWLNCKPNIYHMW